MIIELTDTEIAHIKRALESFYDNDDTGWCTCCESIAAKLGFSHEPDMAQVKSEVNKNETN